MKKSWTRLTNFAKFGSEVERKAKLNYLFAAHHQNSDQMIYATSDGQVLAAIYFHPDALRRIEIKDFVKRIQQELLFAWELKENEE